MSTACAIMPRHGSRRYPPDAGTASRGIRSLALFGSTARGEAGPDSDLDLLVELDPAAEIGLIGYIGLENRLSRLLGHRVDLATRDALPPPLRERVDAEARAVF